MNFRFFIVPFLIFIGFIFSANLPLEAQAQKTNSELSSTPAKKKSSKKKSNKLTINLPQNLLLKEFIKIISLETDTVFIYEEKNLRGQLSITAPPNFSVSKKEAMSFFEKILMGQGLTMVPQPGGKIIEILPASSARFSNLPISQGEEALKPQANFVMRLIRMKYADLKRIQSAIQPIFSRAGLMLTYDPLELLIVVDNAANVNRVVQIIKVLDTPEPGSIEQKVTPYHVKHNTVKEIHQTVSNLFSNIVRSGKQLKFRMVIEERMKTLFIIANDEVTQEILNLIQKVDIPVEGGQTTIHELRYSSAAKIIPLITKIFPKTPSIQIIPFDPLNAMLIIANPVTTQSILKLVNQLDIARGDSQITLHLLENSSSTVLAPLLTTIFADQVVAGKAKGQATSGSAIKIIAEPRLNALLIIADRLGTERVERMTAQLDIPQADGGNIKIRLFPLRYTTSKDMAALLSKIFSGQVVAGKGKGGTAANSAIKIIEEPRLNALILISDLVGMQKVLNLIKKLDVFQENVRTQSNFKLYHLKHAVAKDVAQTLTGITGKIAEVATVATKDAKGATTTPPPPVAVSTTATQQNNISISADAATNSLLIFAPQEVFPTLDKIISELDIQRLQVYVEALIMEVSLSKSLNLGVNWSNIVGDTGGRVMSSGFPGGGPVDATAAAASASQSTFGVLGGGINLGGTDYYSFSAFVKASQTDKDINVLANPQVLMLNNEQSTINVTTNIPVATKSVTDANGVITTNTEFKDIGVQLSILPQISGENSIRLSVQQQTSNIATEQIGGNSNVITTFKRDLKTVIVTKDNEIVVLGGLINETKQRSGNKIPGFGDLPLIGWLFSSKDSNVDKTNLMLFIRSRIIRSHEDLARVTQKMKTRYDRTSKSQNLSEDVLKDMNFQQKETPLP